MPATLSQIMVVPPTIPGVSGYVDTTVSITSATGASAVAYTTLDGSTAFTFPATVSSPTTFYLPYTGTFTVSALIGSQQVATTAYTAATVSAINSAAAVVVECAAPRDNQEELSSRFGSQIWLSAGDFAAGTGTPALGSPASRTTSWLLDAAAVENVRGSWLVPSTWTTTEIKLVWTAAATGDVRWQVAGGFLGNSATPADDIAATEVTASADATIGDIVHTTVIASVAVTPGPAHLRVQRQATNGADTLAVDAQLIGVLITRVS